MRPLSRSQVRSHPDEDYYSLYGVFASSVEPIEPPLFSEPPKTPAYESFRKELEKREKALADFVKTKQVQVVEWRGRA